MSGRYPEGSWVETPYPLTEEQAHGPRDSWPWLPGWVSEVCGPDEWLITVQVPELAVLEDGTPAPEGTPEEEAFFRAASGTPRRSVPRQEPEPEAHRGLSTGVGPDDPGNTTSRGLGGNCSGPGSATR